MSTLQMYTRPDRDEIAAGLGIPPGDYSTYPPLAPDPVAAGPAPKTRAPRQRRDADGLPGPRPRARTAPPPATKPRRKNRCRTCTYLIDSPGHRLTCGQEEVTSE